MINRVLLTGKKELVLNGRALIMGILNLTPDSFSDGGQYFDPEAAIRHAKELVAAGADIIDLGAESTRPGATPLSADEEQARLLPVLDRIASELTVPISRRGSSKVCLLFSSCSNLSILPLDLVVLAGALQWIHLSSFLYIAARVLSLAIAIESLSAFIERNAS